MNALLMVSGLALLGSTSAQEYTEIEKVNGEQQTIDVSSDISQNMLIENSKLSRTGVWPKISAMSSTGSDCEEEVGLDVDEIIFIEEDLAVELGFDTADYLPDNFDPHKLYVDLNAIEYIEDMDDIELNFDLAGYLPQEFDAFADPLGIEGINYIEDEVEIELDFDTAEYLPINFDPYAAAIGQKDITAL